MVVQHNLTAINANRQLRGITNSQAKATEKLSSGYKINRAADDAAGLTISEKMRSQIRGLDRASTNAQDGVSLIQSAEGALNETHSILQRMNELAVQGANDTNLGEDRDAINQELKALTEEIDRISETTQFNKQNLLDGSFTDKKLQIGANTNQNLVINIGAMDAETIGLGVTSVKRFSVGGQLFADSTKAKSYTAKKGIAAITAGTSTGEFVYSTKNKMTAASAKTVAISAGKATIVSGQFKFGAAVNDYDIANETISKVQKAINQVSSQRSALGAIQNRLEHTINNLDTVSENTQAAESRIRDTDMASAMVEYSKNNILSQAGQAMLAQANQVSQGVLSLLR